MEMPHRSSFASRADPESRPITIRSRSEGAGRHALCCFRCLAEGSTVRIALVGCGAIAESFYLPAWKGLAENSGNEIVLVDPNLERARQLARTFDLDEALCRSDAGDLDGEIDGAIVAVPHHLHVPITTMLLDRGSHVLCEKPLATNPGDADVMIEAASSAGKHLMVNNTRRLFGSMAKIGELLRSGAIGELRRFRMAEGGEYNWPTVSGFYFDPSQTGGGVLEDMGAHVLDLVCWWLGGQPEIVEVRDDAFGGIEAVSRVELSYGSATGVIHLSRLTQLANSFVLEGTEGSILAEPFNWRSVRLVRGDEVKTIKAGSEPTFEAFSEILLDNFLGVLGGSQEPRIPAASVRDSIALLEAAYAARKPFDDLPWLYQGVSL